MPHMLPGHAEQLRTSGINGHRIKSSHQLGYLRRTNSPLADSKEQQLEDWVTILVFNHLMSGLEAFVSAHLWDFPDDLEYEVTYNATEYIEASSRL